MAPISYMVSFELASAPYDGFFLMTDLFIVVAVLIPNSSSRVPYGKRIGVSLVAASVR